MIRFCCLCRCDLGYWRCLLPPSPPGIPWEFPDRADRREISNGSDRVGPG
ncbi:MULTISPECIES: hypothetical protein [Planktothricoides]|uniref:Uncharacterized protein n=1 Tax=Planktothricoides raciborskii FACHB-1370 TaxID=2949576 RepID=A0ABR8EPG8_9CYAN|nr:MULTISPECIES: hypothetical protein [Planktothricoides]MBD2547487.1 hypothetical protein [Planktothricoides raciborskii FACHB-1370]MBD2585984.1 hypothetical protein [Planktothricoides raciborskii FACHB-1261]